jgi:hypothetical protein
MGTVWIVISLAWVDTLKLDSDPTAGADCLNRLSKDRPGLAIPAACDNQEAGS